MKSYVSASLDENHVREIDTVCEMARDFNNTNAE